MDLAWSFILHHIHGSGLLFGIQVNSDILFLTASPVDTGIDYGQISLSPDASYMSSVLGTR